MSGQNAEITLLSINRGGIAALSDGSFWRIAPNHLKLVGVWYSEMAVKVAENEQNMLYSHRLTDLQSGASVSITPSGLL